MDAGAVHLEVGHGHRSYFVDTCNDIRRTYQRFPALQPIHFAAPAQILQVQKETGRMPTRDDIVLLASYNASMNATLYAAAATLPNDALLADRGAFFGSVIGTLNHIVAGDIIWLRRFMGHPADFPSLRAMADIPAPGSLAHRYSDDLDELLALRIRLDAIIQAFAAEVSDSDLAQPLAYRNSRGDFRKKFGSLLLHFFNHQTHHRGQASTLLSQCGVDIGVTDLAQWIPDYC